ncbi:MAG: molybdopterin biosynthesis protein [Defluviitaleaceae bacterium]|nr:molybdopterin biosynthesis protein [Defluviitaleaceae bacterium]
MKQRNLYLKTTPIEEALENFYKYIKIKSETEEIEVINSLGRILSRSVFAKYSSPNYNSCAMDGIITNSEKIKNASEINPIILTETKDFLYVNTGNLLKEPFDCVVMIEDITEIEKNKIAVKKSAKPWQHVRIIGEEIIEGELVLSSNNKIRPFDISAMLSSGITTIFVKKQITVAIIPTGSELIDIHEVPKLGNVIESNSYMLEASLKNYGFLANRYDRVKDDYDIIKNAIINATKKNDVVLISAGTSAGTEDYTKDIINELGEVITHGLSVKPGKPVILGIVNDTPVIGLPGYPISCYVTFENIVIPILELLNGKIEQKKVKAKITRKLVSSFKHKEFVRVKLAKIDDDIIATPMYKGVGSSMGLVRADGVISIPLLSEGIEMGDIVDVVLTNNNFENKLTISGGHDILLDIILGITNNVSTNYIGSFAGLFALKKGETHIAAVNILDEETGKYNIPETIKKMFENEQLVIINGVKRNVGFIVAKNNPFNIKNVEDLTKKNVRYINRQHGSGARHFFDYILNENNVDKEKINGYDREVMTNTEVAYAIKNKNADCGIGSESAAKKFGLDFVKLETESFDFVVKKKHLDLLEVKKFREILISGDFIKRLNSLEAYIIFGIGETASI